MLHYLFSLRGRINRAKLWLWCLISALVAVAAMLLRFFAKLDPVLHQSLQYGSVALNILLLWPALALTLKRLHDRNKGPIWLIPFWAFPYAFSAAVLFIVFTPAVSAKYLNPEFVNWIRAALVAGYAMILWAFIELYCLRGTRGENRFGPDPLDAEQKPASP